MRARKTTRTRAAEPVVLAEPVLIDRFWANRKGDAIVTQLRMYEGRALVDVRKFFTDPQGELRPTTKGLSIVVLRLPALAAALVKAERRARELGLLAEDEPAVGGITTTQAAGT
jgi:hypothetical protein